MEERLNIVSKPQDGYILLKIDGRIDGYWSKHLDDYFDDFLRKGNHRAALDLTKVHYISSLGIRILIKYAKLYKQVDGSFGIIASSQSVIDLLSMVGLNQVLSWQSYEVPPSGKLASKSVESDGFVFEITHLKGKQPMSCNLTGNPEKLSSVGFSKEDCKTIAFGRNRYGLGLGAIGLNFEDCTSRFGDFVALGDAVVYSPAGKANNPDYMLKTGSLIPSMEILYGMTFEGEFDHEINFASNEEDKNIKFSQLIQRIFEFTGFETLMMVMLAETSGLVGLSINNSPISVPGGAMNLFNFPEVRDNINFTTEPDYQKMMTITVGIASKSDEGDLSLFTRQLAKDSTARQHFHTAIFAYHPFKKNNIDLDETVSTLFEQDKIRAVLHLINDTREFTGIGESEFKNGFCRIGKINSITKS